jgi:hypothetical protein
MPSGGLRTNPSSPTAAVPTTSQSSFGGGLRASCGNVNPSKIIPQRAKPHPADIQPVERLCNAGVRDTGHLMFDVLSERMRQGQDCEVVAGTITNEDTSDTHVCNMLAIMNYM